LVLKEIDSAIFSLPIAELSDIIETRDGCHVIRVIERTAATRTPFLEAQVAIKERIVDEKRKSAFDKHIAKLKREIPIEYFLNDTDSNAIQSATPRTAKR
jgi:parvulin-like peptidyl-prolyl isomerase